MEQQTFSSELTSVQDKDHMAFFPAVLGINYVV